MKNRIGYLWATLASVTWGLAYSLDQKVLETISPLDLSVMNAVVTLIFLLPIMLLGESGAWHGVFRSKGIGLAFISALLGIVANFCIYAGIKYVGASHAAFLEISYPFFIIIFSFLLWHERPTLSFLCGALLIFAGACLILKGSA